MYTGFFSWQVLLDLLVDNAFLLIVAIGMTFVIVSGGIDLSVGSVVALTTIVEAVLSEHLHWPVWVIVPVVLLMGTRVRRRAGRADPLLPACRPFIVTLAGMFFARGSVLSDHDAVDHHHRSDLPENFGVSSRHRRRLGHARTC